MQQVKMIISTMMQPDAQDSANANFVKHLALGIVSDVFFPFSGLSLKNVCQTTYRLIFTK